MVERDIQIEMPGGTADAVFFVPEEGKQYPGVVFLPDIGSIREAMRVMCRRLADEGYAVLLPNPFYRTGRPPIWPFPRNPDEQRTKDRMEELRAPLTEEARTADASAYVDRLREQPGVRQGKIGIVGHCFTGAMALRMPGTWPDAVAAAASFHGGGLYNNTPQSPHHFLPRIKARLYFGHATNDKSMTTEQIAGLDEALRAWGGTYESEVYPAKHGWTVPDNPAYDEAEAQRAWKKLTQLFDETLR